MPMQAFSQPATPSRRAPDEHAIFIGDLPPDATESQIRHVFGVFGNIVSVNLLRKPIDRSMKYLRIVSEHVTNSGSS
jgi:RNA recognition motif-containing protein